MVEDVSIDALDVGLTKAVVARCIVHRLGSGEHIAVAIEVVVIAVAIEVVAIVVAIEVVEGNGRNIQRRDRVFFLFNTLRRVQMTFWGVCWRYCSTFLMTVESRRCRDSLVAHAM